MLNHIIIIIIIIIKNWIELEKRSLINEKNGNESIIDDFWKQAVQKLLNISYFLFFFFIF